MKDTLCLLSTTFIYVFSFAYAKKTHHLSGSVVASLHLSRSGSCHADGHRSPGEQQNANLHFAGAVQSPSSLRASMTCRDLSCSFSLQL